MPQISYTGAFTPANLNVPDAYFNVTPGPGGVLPASFGLVGAEGLASWGPVNKTTVIGSTAQLLWYGDPVNRGNDLATALAVIVQAQQAAGLGAQIVANRVTDGTDIAASGKIGTVSTNSETATIGGTLSIGDTLHVTFTSAGITGSPLAKTYTTVSGDDLAAMAVGLAAAINADSALQAANVFAVPAAEVVTITYPASLSISFSESVTGTDPTETITLAAASSGSIYGMELTSVFTGSGANGDSWALAAGSNSTSDTPTWRLTLQHPNFPAEIYDNLGAGLSGAALWAALAAAVNHGCPSTYGQPSQIMLASQGTSLAAPSAATGTLSGGTDGAPASPASSIFIGTDSYPRTGIYAFRGSGISDLVIADFDDITHEADLQAFGQSEGIYVHTSGEPGETPSTAQTNKQTQGSFGDNYAWLKRNLGDWVYWNDNGNGVQRLLAPATFTAALLSTLQPQQAGTNKQTPGVVATQRSKTGIPYGTDELAILSKAGIDVICNPIPRGTMFGLRLGFTASGTVETRTDNWPRLTSFIARSLAGPGAVGALVGEEITDDYFTRGFALLDGFFAGLKNPGPGSRPIIQDYQVTFDRAHNPQIQTAQGVVVAQVLVQFFGIALIFLVNMQTGATVVIPANSNVAANVAALAAAA